MQNVTRILEMCERVTNALAISAMFISMIIVSLDAVCRYLFAMPLPWVRFLLILYLLPGIFFMGLPGSYTRGVHVSVDILANAVPARMRLMLLLLARVAGLCVFSLLAWYGWQRFLEAFAKGEIQPGNIFNYPLWPGLLLVPVGTFITALRSAERLIVEARALGAEGGADAYFAANPTTSGEELV